MSTPTPPKLTFKCTACNRTLTTPTTASGKVVTCPCGQKLRVPEAMPSAPASFFDDELSTLPASNYQSSSPYQSPPVMTRQSGLAPTSDVAIVKSGQRFLIFSILGYLCSLPVLALANTALAGTPEQPVITPAFVLLLGLGLLGMLAAACGASFGIYRMGSVLFPGTTQVIYAVGVLIPAPLIGLLVMIVANSKATGYLRAKGVEVGFFGAKS